MPQFYHSLASSAKRRILHIFRRRRKVRPATPPSPLFTHAGVSTPIRSEISTFTTPSPSSSSPSFLINEPPTHPPPQRLGNPKGLTIQIPPNPYEDTPVYEDDEAHCGKCGGYWWPDDSRYKHYSGQGPGSATRKYYWEQATPAEELGVEDEGQEKERCERCGLVRNREREPGREGERGNVWVRGGKWKQEDVDQSS
jgi:hypothetical protein